MSRDLAILTLFLVLGGCGSSSGGSSSAGAASAASTAAAAPANVAGRYVAIIPITWSDGTTGPSYVNILDLAQSGDQLSGSMKFRWPVAITGTVSGDRFTMLGTPDPSHPDVSFQASGRVSTTLTLDGQMSGWDPVVGKAFTSTFSWTRT